MENRYAILHTNTQLGKGKPLHPKKKEHRITKFSYVPLDEKLAAQLGIPYDDLMAGFKSCNQNTEI